MDAILTRGRADWVMAIAVVDEARRVAENVPSAESLEVLREALTRMLVCGLARLGDAGPGGFRAWDLEPTDGVDRAIASIRALERDPLVGELFWLDNTPAGDERADAIDRSS
jgi:hypothetical protein